MLNNSSYKEKQLIKKKHIAYYDIIISGNILKINLAYHQIFVNSLIFKLFI